MRSNSFSSLLDRMRWSVSVRRIDWDTRASREVARRTSLNTKRSSRHLHGIKGGDRKTDADFPHAALKSFSTSACGGGAVIRDRTWARRPSSRTDLALPRFRPDCNSYRNVNESTGLLQSSLSILNWTCVHCDGDQMCWTTPVRGPLPRASTLPDPGYLSGRGLREQEYI